MSPRISEEDVALLPAYARESIEAQLRPRQVEPVKPKRAPAKDQSPLWLTALSRIGEVKRVSAPFPLWSTPLGDWWPEFEAVAGRMFRLDWALPNLRIGVEVDGAVHRTKERFASDREKANLLAEYGWRVFRFTPKELRDTPDVCIGFVTRGIEWRA